MGNTEPTAEALRIAKDALHALASGFTHTRAGDIDAAARIITDAMAADKARIAGLLKNIGVMETALKQIAGSHYERWGMDQTDVEELPDLSGEEAMNLARAALENTNDK